jgi:hypothetical protein
MSTTKTTTETKPKPTVGEILDKAAKSAMRGGTAGAVAMGLNVGALMWMRTTVRLCLVCLHVFRTRLPRRLQRGRGGVEKSLQTKWHSSFVPVRVQVNYQYRNGTSFPVALR